MALKKASLADGVAKAVGAGKQADLETVDFSDPNRPKTCLEIDFPILPINQVAIIEGNAGKPIYQMSKWWARRRSSVFRAMLIAAAAKAPKDPSHAARLVWDNYYANHQKRGAFKKLKVADIFMGGGTTLIEGSRLGMQMSGNDLNPVAWFVVKQELADVGLEEVKKLLAEIEAELKPQLMPYYCCDGPNGEKGTWTRLSSGEVMPPDFDPLTIPREQRKDYRYEGPEIIYIFWAKHGPCQVTGCDHRTPIMGSPVMAVKTLTVKYWEHKCLKCGVDFHIEEKSVRMAPDAPFYVTPGEYPFAALDAKTSVPCPACGHSTDKPLISGKAKNKKVELSLLVHPQWMTGSPKQDELGRNYGGSPQDDAASSSRWNQVRAKATRLLEVRGALPVEVTCPQTNITFSSQKGNVPKKSHYVCAACGMTQDILTSVKATGKAGPMAAYALQCFSPQRKQSGAPYGGRFFSAFDERHARQYDAACKEWLERKDDDLKDYWPISEIPFGFMTGMANGDIRKGHGFTHWWTMFNPRQLLVHAQLLKAIVNAGDYDWSIREYVLGAFQNFLRNQNSFAFWHLKLDKLAPAMSNSNFHPKNNVVEVGVFPTMGYGPWSSTIEVLFKAGDWGKRPWEIVSADGLKREIPDIALKVNGKSEKVYPGDTVKGAEVFCASSTELTQFAPESLDLVITDPPFGGLLHYSELSDFFYVWLRLALKDKYPDYFSADYTPKSLEAVANRAREPEDPNGFYKRLLTQCWLEAHRVLKPGGILAFTFHHSEDAPWVAVLESLFEASFYLVATYPIRSDETKGEGQFGSKAIEYDIIHVCRKMAETPMPVSWGKMRRQVLTDASHLQGILENHAKYGLPAADIQVIRRGKALEYFSRHYGKVYLDEDRPIQVKEALLGINQIIDEGAETGRDKPPGVAEPITRQFLHIFGNALELERDQLQKFLKGTAITPDEFVQRGWCQEKNKTFIRTCPLAFARDWSGKHKRRLASDLDQALTLIGACFDDSGINARDTLNNQNFKPHVALKPLLEWFSHNAPDQTTRSAASRALSIYNSWAASKTRTATPGHALLFEEDEL